MELRHDPRRVIEGAAADVTHIIPIDDNRIIADPEYRRPGRSSAAGPCRCPKSAARVFDAFDDIVPSAPSVAAHAVRHFRRNLKPIAGLQDLIGPSVHRQHVFAFPSRDACVAAHIYKRKGRKKPSKVNPPGHRSIGSHRDHSFNPAPRNPRNSWAFGVSLNGHLAPLSAGSA